MEPRFNHQASMDCPEALHALTLFYHHPNLQKTVCQNISNCPLCPQLWTSACPAGQMAPQIAPILMWSNAHADFIGPWTVKFKNMKLWFNALTCLNPVTNLIKIIQFCGQKLLWRQVTSQRIIHSLIIPTLFKLFVTLFWISRSRFSVSPWLHWN